MINKTAHTLLIVASTYPRWPDDDIPAFVHNLAKGFKHRGWQVDVLAPHAPGANINETIDGIHITRFRYAWPDTAQTVCYNSGALVNLRKSLLNYLKLPLLVLFEIMATRKMIRHNKYSLVNSHWVVPQGFAGIITAAPAKLPHVITVHGGDVFSLNSAPMRMLKRFIFRHADAVAANSSATFNAVKNLCPEVKMLVKIPMGTDVKAFQTSEIDASKLRIKLQPNTAPLLIFVGRLIEEKGLADLIEATRILTRKIPDLITLIVGDGKERTLYESEVRRLGLQNNIIFTGWIQSAQIPMYMAAADVFIGPSIEHKSGWKEAQGLTLLEAMAAKTPVIASNTGGISDFVKHENTGLLVDQASPESIAGAVNRLLQDKSLVETLTANAYQLLMTDYSQENSVSSYIELFNELVTRGHLES